MEALIIICAVQLLCVRLVTEKWNLNYLFVRLWFDVINFRIIEKVWKPGQS